MSRKRLIVALLFCLSVAATGLIPASGKSSALDVLYPPTGDWSFCSGSAEIGCIESLYLTTPSGEVTMVQSSSGLVEVGAEVHMGCTVSSGGRDEQMVAFTNPKPDSCDPSVVVGQYFGCERYASAIVSLFVSWPAGVGGSIATVVRTGAFEPAFSLGVGTTNAQIIRTEDGQYKYVWLAKMEVNHSLSNTYNPSAFGGTTVADYAQVKAAIGVFPRSYFFGSAYAYSWPNPFIGRGECVQRPIDGSWASANAQSFTGDVFLGKYSTKPEMVNTLKFSAYGPHFKLPATAGGSQSTLNEPNFRVFLSPVFLNSVGCSSQCDTLSAALKVSTDDNQTASPSATKFGDGYLVDLGISHFSAPNPVFAVSRVGPPIQSERNWKSTTTLMPSPTRIVGAQPTGTTAVQSTAKFDRFLKAKKQSKMLLLKIFTPSSRYSARWSVTGGCRIAGRYVSAKSSPGTCVVKLVELQGKIVKRTRTASISIS